LNAVFLPILEKTRAKLTIEQRKRKGNHLIALIFPQKDPIQL